MAAEEGSGGGGGAGAGEKKSSQAPAKPGAGGAGKFLAGLPSRGNFSSGFGSSNLVQTLTLKNPLLYICTFFARALRRLDSRGEVGSEPVLSRCDLRREGSGFTSASTARIPQVSGFSLRFYEESALHFSFPFACFFSFEFDSSRGVNVYCAQIHGMFCSRV